ncbi:UbiA family prenyltransferase [Spartinivicinus poritis]|uniref:UbiA family prenyltransferase n=1 Tax=Spartinivicinus poritis TaxID=2994640 RepID=A0ABT5U9H8_9GAMM|nr:UbiA family prenyltransferase [Spartinivicinus sp. A2-2]MDE1463024.1 UbiA family prenyltransferase [Spartinivicinus sp. A2-2]
MSTEVKYIFVDLDGTLVRTDLFLESILKLIKQKPFYIFQIIFWLLQGRQVAKAKVANLVEINAENLPYTTELVDYLKTQKKQGKRLILATASNQAFANTVAKYLGIFDQVIASDNTNNLKGSNKLASIQNIVGNDNFSYAGDSLADRPIWQKADSNIFVNAPLKDIEKAKRNGKAEKIITPTQSTGLAFIKAMRVHQWVKNLLVFVPLFTSHSYYEPATVFSAVIAFLSFSICASGGYFLNDMLDLEADRNHNTKRFRPLAAGTLPLSIGIASAIILPLLSFILAWLLLPLSFFIILVFYYIAINAYSFIIKRVSTADVMTLAILYTTRIVAGSVAIGVTLSSWLLGFSIFIFVSLAYLKRYIELYSLAKATHHNANKASGRGYSVSDQETMFTLGIANITASVLVLSLYINSEEVTTLYQSPQLLWLLCFLILYWGNRVWVGARRGKIADDPIVFAIKDRVSQFVGFGFLIVVLSAKYFQI